MLEIKDLRVNLEDENKEILKGVDLSVEAGKVHAIMGPNGSGKSTLSYVLSGKDGYEVVGGSVKLDGLDILDGKVTKIKASKEVKVPHMGWNEVKFLKEHLLLKNIPDSSFFYFVHSYCCLSSKDALTETIHGERFVSCIAKDNIFAVQFHPEKSQGMGLELYKNFLNWNI